MARSAVARALVALALVLAATATAVAAVTWYEHYRRGLRLERDGRWQEAVTELDAALALAPEPRARARTYGSDYEIAYDPHVHLAHCLAELGRWPEAAGHLARSRAAGVTPADRLEPLERRIQRGLAAASEPSPTVSPPAATPTPASEATPVATAALVVDTVPAGATVVVDGVVRGASPLGPLTVPAGTHRLRFELAGHRPVERPVELESGSTLRLELTLEAEATPAPSPAAEVARSEPSPSATAAPAPPLVVATATPVPVATASPAVVPTASGGARGGLGRALAMVAVVASGLVWWLLRGRRRRPTTARGEDLVPTALAGPVRLGRYRCEVVLGRGGMATTYRAVRDDGTVVAVKLPHDSLLGEPSFVARFLREGRLGEQLHHPRIVRILEAGEEGGRPFLAMELLPGRTLRELLRAEGPLPVRRALELARDVAEALDYAHAKGVVHRDLKPDNIMVLPSGELKVMDFGIARLSGQEGLTASAMFLGTPLYAAPESVEPRTVDHRADLYSLGIVLYELLQGGVPFRADSPFAVMEAHRQRPLPAATELARPLPDEVWAVVVTLCAKQPDRRYPSAEALLVELARLLRDLPPDP